MIEFGIIQGSNAYEIDNFVGPILGHEDLFIYLYVF